MALIDHQNKVIYWDEVNWQWLPFMKVERNKKHYLVRESKRFPINSGEDIANLLTSFGYCLSSLQDLGIIEVQCGCFVYNGSLYKISGANSSILTFFSVVLGKSKTWAAKQINGEGVLSKNFINDLEVRAQKIIFNGNFYNSYNQLAKEMGISSARIYGGLSKGKSLEEIVDSYKGNFVIDHLGQKYKTIVNMCKNWGIPPEIYHRRRKKGWSLEKILTTPVKKVRERVNYVDFKGNVFYTATSMAKEYNVSIATLLRLLDEGKTSEEVTYILSQKVPKEERYKDHLGNKFSTKSKMLDTYGVKRATFSSRLSKGWSLEEALTGKQEDK